MESSTTKVPPRHPFHGMRRKSEASIKTIMESGRDIRLVYSKIRTGVNKMLQKPIVLQIILSYLLSEFPRRKYQKSVQYQGI